MHPVFVALLLIQRDSDYLTKAGLESIIPISPWWALDVGINEPTTAVASITKYR